MTETQAVDAATTCSEKPEACQTQPKGTLATGTACGENAQCQSAYCLIGGTTTTTDDVGFMCGVCADRIALGQHCSLEPRIDAHLGPSSGDCRQHPCHRRTLGGGGGQVDEAGQRGRRRFVSREEFEPKWPTGIKRSGDHTHW